MHEALDLCLSCKGCSSDCPAGVDMATYKAEALHQRYRRRLRPAVALPLGWLPRWADARRAAPAAGQRARCGRRRSRLLAKRLGGIDQRRPLPAFAPQHVPAAGSTTGTAPGPTGDPVLLWVDTFTDHFSPEVGQAAVAVLEDAGFRVQIPAQAGLLRADLDLHRPAGRRAPPAAPHAWTRSARRWRRGRRSSGSSRPARPCCARTRSSCCPDDPRAAAAGRVDPHAGRAARRHGRRWTPPSLAGVDGRRPAALPPARGDGLGRRRGAADRRRARR